jgi:hypothetical protein
MASWNDNESSFRNNTKTSKNKVSKRKNIFYFYENEQK